MAQGSKTGGRAAGTPNKLTQASRERILADGDPIGFLLDVMNGEEIKASPTKDGTEVISIIPTLDQRQAAANTLARKLVPDAKNMPITIDIPQIENSDDAVRTISVVLMAVANGEITPSEGQVLSGIVENYRKAIETHELEQRISSLERAKLR